MHFAKCFVFSKRYFKKKCSRNFLRISLPPNFLCVFPYTCIIHVILISIQELITYTLQQNWSLLVVLRLYTDLVLKYLYFYVNMPQKYPEHKFTHMIDSYAWRKERCFLKDDSNLSILHIHIHWLIINATGYYTHTHTHTNCTKNCNTSS